MEKREFIRFNIEEPVGVHAGASYRVEKSRDFSEGGMLFESDRAFTQGDKLSVTFKISDTILFELEATVAHVTKGSSGCGLVGVQFLDTDHVKILRDYFKNRGRA
jgi:hypothetical protein